MNFIELIKNDMKPALGVTEPAAIALACAKARSLCGEEPVSVSVEVNSGIYKNAYTCGIPNTSVVGNEFAAALGCWFGDADKNLMVLDDITEENVEFCRKKIEEGKVEVLLGDISSEISIKATVKSAHDICEAHISGKHTNISFLCRNENVLKDESPAAEQKAEDGNSEIENASLLGMYNFAKTVNIEELSFIAEAYKVNNALADAAFENPRCVFAAKMLSANSGKKITENPEKTAMTLSVGAAEARVLGLNYPAMSITGSGNHGIICTMPLYGYAKATQTDDEMLLRATALSYLVTMYIKHYSGVLSSLCGCAIAAGTGMACGLSFMKGGDYRAIYHTLLNMTNSITGMICQGGNHGCVMKVVSAVKLGFSASQFAMDGAFIEECHGIGDYSAEQTMRNIGLIANPGMAATEEIIVNIMKNKDFMAAHD